MHIALKCMELEFNVRCMELEFECKFIALKCMELEFDVHVLKCMELEFDVHALKCLELKFEVHGKCMELKLNVHATEVRCAWKKSTEMHGARISSAKTAWKVSTLYLNCIKPEFENMRIAEFEVHGNMYIAFRT